MRIVKLGFEIDSVWVFEDVSVDLVLNGAGVACLGSSDSGAAELLQTLSGATHARPLGRLHGDVELPNTSSIVDRVPVGFVGPEPAEQVVGLSVSAELEWARSTSRAATKGAERLGSELVDILGLTQLAPRRVATLSSGQLQRLAIASVALADPDLLVLDNCFSVLDDASLGILAEYGRKRTERNSFTWYSNVEVLDWGLDFVALQMLGGRLRGVGSGNGVKGETHSPAVAQLRELTSLALNDPPHLQCVDLIVERILIPSHDHDTPRLSAGPVRLGCGHAVGFRGPNGSGKTTLLRALLGLERGGEVSTNWANRGWPQAAYLPAEGVPNWVCRGEHAGRWARIGIAGQSQAQAVQEVLELDRFAAIHGGTYRSRMNPWRRLWWVLGAVASGVPWLLLDEPTRGLDRGQREVLVTIVNKHKNNGGGALIASHDGPFLFRCCDSIVEIVDGRPEWS